MVPTAPHAVQKQSVHHAYVHHLRTSPRELKPMLLYLRPAHVFVQTYAARYKYELQIHKKSAKYDHHWMLDLGGYAVGAACNPLQAAFTLSCDQTCCPSVGTSEGIPACLLDCERKKLVKRKLIHGKVTHRPSL